MALIEKIKLSRRFFFVQGKIQTLPSDLAFLKIHGSGNFKAEEKFIKQHFWLNI